MYIVSFPMNVYAFDIYDHAKRNGAETVRVRFSNGGNDPLVNRMRRIVSFTGKVVDFSNLKVYN
ncbi:MAG: hypothetical protein WD512_18250 [Candidatus Paceibacterota bacterium]